MFLIFFSTLTSSCSDDGTEHSENLQTPFPTIAEQEQPLLIYEEYESIVQEAGQYVRFNKTSINNLTIYIDSEEYSPESCTDIIYDAVGTIRLLEESYGFASPERLNIYIGNKIITQGTEGNIYLNSGDLKSIDGLIAMMTGFSGELVNYGLCYGLGLHIIIEEGLKDTFNMEGFDETYLTVPDSKLNDYYSEEDDLIILDFTPPVFETEYFSEEDNLYAVSAAYLFTQYVIDNYGISEMVSLIGKSHELTLDFDISYTERCNEWLSSMGALCRRSTPEAAIRCVRNYGRTGTTYKYVFHTRDMRSYIPKDHFDEGDGIVLTYPEVIKMLTLGEADLVAAKEYLSPYLNTDLAQVPCYYFEKKTNKCYGDYIDYSTPYRSFVHEYVHYITYEYLEKNEYWINEAIAAFIQHYIQGKLIGKVINCDILENSMKKLNESDEENDKEFYNEIEKVYNAILSKRDAYEVGVFCDGIACLRYTTGNSPVTSTIDYVYGGRQKGGYISYQELASMVNYLINEYGADTFFSVYKGEITLEEAYGYNVDELYEKWGMYIIMEYGEIMKIDIKAN